MINEIELAKLDIIGTRNYGGASIVEKMITVPANDSVSTGSPIGSFVSAWFAGSATGAEITPVGTIDPTNVSTGDASLINDVNTDLVYNNSSQGSANKELPAVDLGSSVAVANVEIWWWNNTYTAGNYSIQGSNDGTTWSDLVTGLDSTGVVGTAANPQQVAVSGSWQYLRVFCVAPTNASWVVVSEMNVFAPAGSGSLTHFASNSDYSVVDDGGGNSAIVNNSAAPVDFTVYCLEAS